MDIPSIRVGIVTEKALCFVFNGEYVNTHTGEILCGEQRVLLVGNKIVFNSKLYDQLLFKPLRYERSSFGMKAVTIGVDFHWQRKEDQCFQGSLQLLCGKEGIIAINEIGVEDYLCSVISSEMNASASESFLKAHAVISRSWLLAQIGKTQKLKDTHRKYQTYFQDHEELVRWYDREDHDLFDVCADDHCQRYQGITRVSSSIIKDVVSQTRGEVLVYDDEICDARFSKCCGGVTEEFQYCWEPVPHPYLKARLDRKSSHLVQSLRNEVEADRWIRSAPESFCYTTDQNVLRQVLNNYDQETHDFYRWKVSYTQDELTDLICRKIGMSFGQIIDLIPLARGTSGRISRLKIVGSHRTYTIGKELEIRRTLSETHLYSSAFVVDKEDIYMNVPQRFILTGAGWGHGVGLCQIGAAVMGANGYDYEEILMHYFPGAAVKRWY